MPRGKVAKVGDTKVAQNGYHYTKTANRGWVLTHWLTAEKELGREITNNETVRFKDPKYKKDPYNPNGFVVLKKRTSSLRKRAAMIEAKIAELQNELEMINEKINLIGE
jgi:cell division protein FtsB